MSKLSHVLFTRLWWSYDSRADGYDQLYHWINLIEGCFWLVFAVLVFRRFLANRQSSIELVYALAFLTFGLSDFREAFAVHSWLILFKGANLAAILVLRRIVIRRFYPASKTF